MGSDGGVTALVVENDPTDDIRRLGEWLTEGGLTLEVCRPYRGEALPATLDGYAALIILGGDQHAYPDEHGEPGAPWFPALESLLRKAVRFKIATLGICLGGQLLAAAHGGVIARSASGPEFGAGLVARRDAAETDPIWRYVPFVPDVLQWHYDEIVQLPRNATLLAASTRYPHQAFRLGERAWGTQFHIECDVDMIAEWAATNTDLGADADDVVEECAAIMDDIADVWQAFALRFAAVAKGELSTTPIRTLPLAGH
ncbi:MAG TPA: type 1 glutamine amidotransferase [Micromonosporaceae bacterium]